MNPADDLALAHRLADLADAVTMRYFRTDALGTEFKGDGSPVTLADKEAERVIRAELAAGRPADGVIGEEYGSGGDAERHWIVDPIDGTWHFTAGKTAWSTLIGLRAGDRVTTGLASAPALGRRWWARTGEGAWASTGGGDPEKLRVSATATLAESTVGIWPVPRRLTGDRARVGDALRTGARALRPGPGEGDSLRDATGHVHGGIMVAGGELDAYALLGGGPWDHAAVVPIVEEAGGRFTDLDGGRRVDTRAGLYSNGHVHDELLAVIAEALRG